MLGVLAVEFHQWLGGFTVTEGFFSIYSHNWDNTNRANKAEIEESGAGLPSGTYAHYHHYNSVKYKHFLLQSPLYLALNKSFKSISAGTFDGVKFDEIWVFL